MPVRSAGLLLYRWRGAQVELLLVHPGGPFWARKDQGAWSIPKGEHGPGEEPLAAARREFREETGAPAPEGPFLPLGEAVQPSRKVVTAFAAEGAFDPVALASNMVEITWPPRSGRPIRFPEVDRAGWFAPDEARRKILKGQVVFVDRLLARLGDGGSP